MLIRELVAPQVSYPSPHRASFPSICSRRHRRQSRGEKKCRCHFALGAPWHRYLFKRTFTLGKAFSRLSSSRVGEPFIFRKGYLIVGDSATHTHRGESFRQQTCQRLVEKALLLFMHFFFFFCSRARKHDLVRKRVRSRFLPEVGSGVNKEKKKREKNGDAIHPSQGTKT